MSSLPSYWMIPIIVALVGAALTLLTLWQMRRRRQNKLALRVLAGQRRLLGEEVDERFEELAEIDEEDLRSRLDVAIGLVDGLHVGLLERQAHLQNIEDLAHLQRHKIAVLGHHRDEAASQAPEQPPPIEDEPEQLPQTREDLEDDLLGRISQHTPPRSKRRLD
ncbi:MAG: hypothetical protein VX255_19220 [Candidatus Latescibacterota bacterium]|nr:hypothetical protein [Candidatus Latescibacterota bacterium]